MKYKLTKAAIEELKAMEFEDGWTYDRAIKIADSLFDLFVIDAHFEIFEPIAEKLPKPVLRSVEDLKALEGWEYGLRDWANSDYRECNEWRKDFDFMKFGRAKIRQIDMPENEYLVKDCIEQEIEVGDLFEWKFREAKEFFVAKKNEGGIIRVINGTTCQTENCKLIRKAADITAEDREKYLGEKQDDKEPISIADYQAHKDREFEAKVREIIKKVLKEEAGE